MPQAQATQPTPRDTGPDDVMSGIDAVLEQDAEYYEGPDDDSTVSDDGADSDTADYGATNYSDGRDDTTGSQEEEPELPVELPRQPAPSPQQYDQENPRGYQRVGSLFAD